MTKEIDVRFITIDSLPFEQAKLCGNVFLNDAFGEVRRAETHGTYTYPAHHAFFSGNLPRPTDGSEILPGIGQIWRSSSARDADKTVLQPLGCSNVVYHYTKKGHNVLGVGGVSFFDINDPNNTLPRMFSDNFLFYNTRQIPRPLTRSIRQFPLGHQDEILDRLISDDRPYFLFMNCPETHIPYDTPFATHDPREYAPIVDRLRNEHYLQKRYIPGCEPLSSEECALLAHTQRSAFRWVDDQLSGFFNRLPIRRPTLTVICGDHGEDFGENGRYGHAHPSESVMHVPIWAHYEE